MRELRILREGMVTWVGADASVEAGGCVPVEAVAEGAGADAAGGGAAGEGAGPAQAVRAAQVTSAVSRAAVRGRRERLRTCMRAPGAVTGRGAAPVRDGATVGVSGEG
ncbi:hypothetical protein BEH93_02805 [Streptomyces sp. 2R]|nr:hypothetical protein BEH93_02805 [Streptomyces sp. 2R]